MTSVAVDTRTGGRATRYVLFSTIFFRPRVRSAAVRRRRCVPTYLVPTYTFNIIPSHCTPRAYTPLLSRRRVAVACSACRSPLTFSSSAVGRYFAFRVRARISFFRPASLLVAAFSVRLSSFSPAINITSADIDITIAGTDKPVSAVCRR